MRAIENKLKPGPGLYLWTGASGKRNRPRKTRGAASFRDAPADAANEADAGVRARHRFQHARQLRRAARRDRDLWAALERKFPGDIYAFEHRTLSESPIEQRLDTGRGAAQRRARQPGVALARRPGGRPALPGRFRRADRRLQVRASKASATPTSKTPRHVRKRSRVKQELGRSA